MPNLLTSIGGGWIPYALVVAIALGLFGYGHYLGSSSATATWQAKYSQLQAGYSSAALAEGTRQAAANNDAKQREAERIATIEAQSAAIQNLQRKLDDEQDNDPTASPDCINDAGRMRLNQIR